MNITSHQIVLSENRKGVVKRMDFILKTNQLTKQYKLQKAVDNVSVSIERGSIYGLIGRNGAGKTTFLKMIGGLAAPTSGDIELMGCHLTDGTIHNVYEKLGALIEQPGIYKNMTAFENCRLKALCCGVFSEDYVKGKLAMAGLENVGNKTVGNFSLGMKQRLGIAMATIGEPEMLILDEPINGLDPQGIIEVRDIIHRINTEQKITILISSHILEELSKLATHYGIIHNGRLIEQLSHDELLEKCTSRLEILTDNAKKTAKVLKNFGCHYSVVDDRMVFVNDRLDKSAAINKALVNAGIEVESLYRHNQSLEEYFISLISRA